MTDEQIIKHWNEIDSEIINEHGEEFDVYITMPVAKSTVDLINRQKAEIERLERKANTPFCQVTFDEEKLKEIANEFAENIEFDLNQLKSEVIKEFAEKINELLARYSHLHNNAENARRDTIEAADGTDIEMQSVWDVFTLKNNKMAEYEEMNGLQKNIEVIAEERLLKEIEKDFRLLVKEMTEVK